MKTKTTVNFDVDFYMRVKHEAIDRKMQIGQLIMLALKNELER
jgi:hypothetical protein